MGKSYTVICRYCGAQFDHYVFCEHDAQLPQPGQGEYIETEMPIRCPCCHRKLNTFHAESDRQIEVTYM